MKKVLIITYYWPPSGGGGVQRWLKMSKYLPEYGWQPIIYTPANPHFDLKDETLQQDVSEEIEVITQPIWEPYRLYERFFNKKEKKQEANSGLIKGKGARRNWKDTLLSKVRSWFFIPDPRVFWVKPSVRFLRTFLKQNPVDAIITTGPPHSMHLIGLGLKPYTDAYWVADFRDAWTKLDYLKDFNFTKSALRRQEAMEAAVLQAADKVLIVTPNLADWHSELSGRQVDVLYNGYDAPDFQTERPRDTDRFIISHFGLLNNLRNPSVLWQALDSLCAEDSDFYNQLDLRLGGVVDPSIKEEIATTSHLSQRVTYYPYVDHQEVMQLNAASSVLLLCINNTYLGKYFMTGKIFEYLALHRPVLCMSTKESDAAHVLDKTAAGVVFPYETGSFESIKYWLKEQFAAFPEIAYQGKQKEIARFSRKNLTRELVDMLEDSLFLDK